MILFLISLSGCETDLADLILNAEEKPPIKFIVADKSAEPLLIASNPWENGLIGYCTVLKTQATKWEMWYESFPTNSNDDYNSYLCYATSENGIDWVKPNLGLVDYNGNKDNNIIFSGTDMNGIHGPFVFKENGRYHLIVNQRRRKNEDPEYSIAMATSEDGVNWSDFIKIFNGYSDTQNVLLDFKKKKKLFVREWIGEVSIGERAVGISRSKSTLPLLFDKSELAYRNNFEEDIYTSGAINLNDNLTLCLNSIFNKPKEEIYLGLTYSRDGDAFYKYNEDVDWQTTDNSWDNKTIYASPSLINAGNDSTYYLYYSGSQKNHDTPISSNEDYITGIGRFKVLITDNNEE
ncbi:hypothetical protein ABWH96_04070 [Marivirga tractuosa]|uniref:hypothetical protein n=1 Tax=Marivirga tractuosa TaxID=1006 RepID=UPI0035D03C3A